MPSFDVVSEVDMHELRNAVDQANRDIGNRFDFKGSGAKIEQTENNLQLLADNDFRIKQMQLILNEKLAKRGIDVRSLEEGDIEIALNQAKQKITVRQGIDADLARKLVKMVKEMKLKTQAAIQGDQLRVTGKKRDDLQQVIAMLKEAKVNLPLQFINFRD